MEEAVTAQRYERAFGNPLKYKRPFFGGHRRPCQSARHSFLFSAWCHCLRHLEDAMAGSQILPDYLGTQIGKKFISQGLQVEVGADDAAMQCVPLAGLADQEDRPNIRDHAVNLHRAALVALGDNR